MAICGLAETYLINFGASTSSVTFVTLRTLALRLLSSVNARQMDERPHNYAPFKGISSASAIGVLRRCLVSLGVDNALEYRTHDLRRGHALDLQLSGAPLWEFLSAGEWKSPAFLQYLDLHSYVSGAGRACGRHAHVICVCRLDSQVVMQAHVDESDGED